MKRRLTVGNVGTALAEYSEEIASVGGKIQGKLGLKLLHEVKREPIGTRPYPDVTLFEAANRIMTDLVILNGVKWLLEKSGFPFSEYRVEYGNEDSSAHDLMAENEDERLVGEAFNVAPSFFHGKKTAMLKKLRTPENKTARKLILANEDAVGESYGPQLKPTEHMVLVDVFTGSAKMWSADPKR